ncbi:MAG TPA: hypothetical protein ENH31_00315 [Nitrospirae bacterium]|nr:hypothetical protein [Nitrospirota bacterium]HDK80995.1 hypothetical protein [Nitrospirota bacterium]
MAEVAITVVGEDKLSPKFKAIEQTGSAAFAKLKSATTTAFSAIKASGSSAYNKLKSGVLNYIDTSNKKFDEMKKKVSAVFEKMKGRATDFFKGLVGFEILKRGLRLLKDMAKGTLDVASSYEQYEFRLSALLGSQEAANEAMKRYLNYASRVPHSLEDIIQAGVGLEAFGATSKTWMEPLGDLAFVMGVTLPEAASALGRAYAGGAGAADIFRERGILNIIKDAKGIEDLSKLTLPEFHQAMLDAFTDPEGKIAGAASRAAGTWSGMISMIEDSIYKFRKKIMDSGAFDSLKTFITEIKEDFDAAFETGRADEWASKISSAVDTAISILKIMGKTVGYVLNNLDALAVGLTVAALTKAPLVFNLITASLVRLKAAALGAAIGISTLGLGLLAIIAYKFGQRVDETVYKLTGIDLSGLNKPLEDLAEIQKDLASSTSALNAKIVKLGLDGISTQEQLRAAWGKGEVYQDAATKKWVVRETQKQEAVKKSEEAVKAFNKAMDEAASVASALGDEVLKFAGADLTANLEKQRGSIEGMKKALEGYLSITDNVYNTRIRMLQVLEQTALREIQMVEVEKAQAKSRLANWTQYYDALQTLHAAVVDKQKQKTQELLDFEKQVVAQKVAYRDLELSLQQQLMTESEKYFSTQERLEEKYRIAAGLTGQAKIDALKEWQTAAAAAAKEVREGDEIIVSSSDAVGTAFSQIARAQKEIEGAQAGIKTAREAELVQLDTYRTKLETAMTAAQTMMKTYTDQVINLGLEISYLKTDLALTVDVKGALGNIKLVKMALDEISDVTYKQIVITTAGGASTSGGSSIGGGLGGSGFFGFDDVTPSKDGTDYVPKTGLYLLHPGEGVLTKEDNRDYRTQGGGDITYAPIFHISHPDADVIAKKVDAKLSRLVKYGRSKLAEELKK